MPQRHNYDPAKLREPGIEPGPTPWQGAILPLDHSRLQSPCSLMDKALAS